MQQWEYMIVNVLRSYGMNYRANGRKVVEWKDIPLHEMMGQLGKAGYEFVAYDGTNYIFKRPLAKRTGNLKESDAEKNGQPERADAD